MQHDNENIYLRYRVSENYVKGDFKKDQDMVCLDSTVEFFVRPNGSGPYYNFETNCIGTMLLYEIQVKNRKKAGAVPMPAAILEKVKRFPTLSRSIRGEIANPTVWELGLCIPASIFPEENVKTPLSGQVWTGNIYKCADWTSHPCWLVWKECETFHSPSDFGRLIFE